MNSPVTAPAAPLPPCRVCGASVQHRFSAPVLGDVTVHYHECSQCHSLQAASPHWLHKAYNSEFFVDPDHGALRRVLFIHRVIRRLRSWPLRSFGRKAKTLDFGSGRGILLRLLLDDGHQACGYDPYPGAIYGQDRIHTTVPDDQYDLISFSEVIEHMEHPVNDLQCIRDRLKKNGVLILTTELYDAKQHGPGWHYLAPEHGQHITFLSQAGLTHVLSKAGLCVVTSLLMNRRPFLHICVRSDSTLARIRALFHLFAFRHRWAERWQRQDWLA